MKRIALIWVIAVVAAPSTPAFAASTAVASSLPHSHLAGFRCHTALLPVDRSVSIRAVMRPVASTEKMEMRFELLSRPSPGAAFTGLQGGGLDSWISPTDSTLGQRSGDVWIVSHPVADLPAPAYYRYRVSFRWTGAGGRVLATRTRRTVDCYQPELRPDLLVSSIAVVPLPNAPGKDQYLATIENRGLTAAQGPFAVTFTPGASSTPGINPVTTTKTLMRLDAGATRNVAFVGPACTASTAPTVVVDPADTVDEYSYTNNSLTVNAGCPPLTPAAITVP
jgi:hypothetical protein